MKRKIILLVIGVLAGFLITCGKKDLQVVCSPEEVVGMEGDKLTLTYQFNQPVDPSTVVSGISLIVSTDLDPDIRGTITMIDEQTFKFKSLKPVSELFGEAGGKVKVRLVGVSNSGDWIADLDGRPIDGDYRGGFGGDFKAEYLFEY